MGLLSDHEIFMFDNPSVDFNGLKYFFPTYFKVICIGKEKATASTEKNLRKATVKPTGNIVSGKVTTPKKERVTATATATTPTVVRMVSLSQISIEDCYKLVIRKLKAFFKQQIHVLVLVELSLYYL